MLAQITTETVNSITSIVIATIITTASVYVAKLIIGKLIDRYFNSIDTRNKEFKQVTTDLQSVTYDIKRIAESLLHQKESTEEFKTQIESRLENLTEQQTRDLIRVQAKLEEEIDILDKNINIAIMQVRQDINNAKIDYGSQFTEIKRRLDKHEEDREVDRKLLYEAAYKKQ